MVEVAVDPGETAVGLLEVNVKLGVAPVPVSDMVCGVLAALSAMLMDAVSAPYAVGVKVTVMAHVAPTARVFAEQVSLSVNEVAFVPESVTVETVSGAPPEFVRVTV
jgi:hypothetical protein